MKSRTRSLCAGLLILCAPLLACNLAAPPTPAEAPTIAAPAPSTPQPPAATENPTSAPILSPQTPQAGECSATPTGSAQVNAYMQPSLLSNVFGTLPPSESVVIVGRSAEGWLGFDPGVAQAGNTGIDRLRWIPPNSPVMLSGDCGNLSILASAPDGAAPGSTLPPAAEPTLVIINFPGGVPADVCSVGPVTGPVNIRSGPGTNFGIIGTMYTPAQFVSAQGDWYTIRLPDGSNGWVSSTVVKKLGMCDGGRGNNSLETRYG